MVLQSVHATLVDPWHGGAISACGACDAREEGQLPGAYAFTACAMVTISERSVILISRVHT